MRRALAHTIALGLALSACTIEVEAKLAPQQATGSAAGAGVIPDVPKRPSVVASGYADGTIRMSAEDYAKLQAWEEQAERLLAKGHDALESVASDPSCVYILADLQ